MTERLSDERLAAIRRQIRDPWWRDKPVRPLDVERLLDEVVESRARAASMPEARVSKLCPACGQELNEHGDCSMSGPWHDHVAECGPIARRTISNVIDERTADRATIAAQNAMIAALQQGESQDPKTSWSKGMSDAADIVESKKDRDLAEIIRISRDMVVAAQPVSFKDPSQCP